jgi:hypothetical protein
LQFPEEPVAAARIDPLLPLFSRCQRQQCRTGNAVASTRAISTFHSFNLSVRLRQYALEHAKRDVAFPRGRRRAIDDLKSFRTLTAAISFPLAEPLAKWSAFRS